MSTGAVPPPVSVLEEAFKTTQSRAVSPISLPHVNFERDGFEPVITYYHALKDLPFVDAVYANRGSEGYEMWVVINGAGETEREQIYARELALLKKYPDLGMDFDLVDRLGRPIEEIAADWQAEITLRVVRETVKMATGEVAEQQIPVALPQAPVT